MSQIIAFTICSNNYLAQAKSLAESYLRYHPSHTFKIGLVDRNLNGIEYHITREVELIPVENIAIDEFFEIKNKYNITELNTAVKPSYFNYFFQKYKANHVIYLDPDILIFSPLVELENILEIKNIVVTPHILTPIDDEYAPTDYHTLRGGIFNLGFIALSNYNKVTHFLTWWHNRVVKYGYADFARSMFYDQIWLNYLPTMFDEYYIIKHPGYNMANWNLHERQLAYDGTDWIVNNQYPLRFFHFSGYKLTQPDILCSYNTRYNFSNRPDVKNIFTKYYSQVLFHDWEKIHKIKCFYQSPIVITQDNIWKRIMNRIFIIYKAIVKGYL
jgi:hypothetical protein